MRAHLFEFEDLPWFPHTIRSGGTDYLRYFLNATKFYDPVVPILRGLMRETGENVIIDLCSGGGGNIAELHRSLIAEEKEVTIILTDKFPNLSAYQHINIASAGKITHVKESVDAMRVPEELKGIRTMFSAIHHFRPEEVKLILADAVRNRQPIALFDGGDKSILTVMGILIIQPVTFLLFTPFFKPFRLSRIFFTYILPLIPIMTAWDGVVSIMRLYRPDELLRLAHEADKSKYEWKAGTLRNKAGMKITYLTGVPL